MQKSSMLKDLRAPMRRLRSFYHGYTTYTTCFGVVGGSTFLAERKIRPGSYGRKIQIAVPGSRARLFLRLGTTDIYVFNSIYREGQYDWNFPVAPRVIVDAGAYTGLSTAFFAMRYPKARIIAIEPDEENFELLLQNTASYSNVHAVRAAIWSESGSVCLTDPGVGSWGFRLNMPAKGESPAMTIRAMTINDVMREYRIERIDLLKLDIEGSEKEVFVSSDPWIGSVDAICLELHDRFKAGCSRAFFKAVDDFPIELRRGEDVLVLREQSPLTPLAGAAPGKAHQ
jgi:FkbM family methyltransferase